ncbi:MAG: hypothetical protein HKM93_08480 [Desulfobacteraceae bacterium]|nr:hypothetical protein [Desulfobacteraceae bacterium]
MALRSVHFILTYMCNFECDHCFLSCGPTCQGTFSLNQVDAVLKDLEGLKTVDSVGFEGGEPFLFHPLLNQSVKLAAGYGFKTSIQTNSYWATNESDAILWLEPLHQAGLSLLEVSDDSFHHGDADESPAQRALAAAQILGLNTREISILKPSVCGAGDQEKGQPIYRGGPKLRGRAVETLVDGMPLVSWKKMVKCPYEDLRNPKRVHIDSFGTVHLCQGLSMGNLWEVPLSDLFRAYDPDNHPICGPILRGGPAQLANEYGLDHEEAYVDACHMCSRACKALMHRFPEYLGPRQVYGL